MCQDRNTFVCILLGGEISEKVSISRKFKQEIVQPILKVKLNFHHKNLRGLFLGGDGLCCVGQTTDGKLKHFSNVHFSYPNFAWWEVYFTLSHSSFRLVLEIVSGTLNL